MKLRSQPAYRYVLLAAVSGVVLSAPATAGRDDPAPIVYKGQGDAATAQQGAAPVQVATTEGKRVEFRYPDQPDRVYSDGVVRSVESDAPIAFSSSQAAISADAARQYAYVEAPLAGQAPAHDPALTTGSFDARATAQRIAARASQQTATVTPAANSYSLPGQVHSPAAVADYDESGMAGVYGAEYEGQPTANGEIYTGDAMTAAHPTLPLPSLVQVINPVNGQEVVVRVNDRGPFAEGRVIDVSEKASQLLGLGNANGSPVRVRYLGPAPVASAVRTVSAEDPVPSAAPAARVAEFELPPLYQSAPTQTPAPQRASIPMGGDFFIQLGSFSNIGNAQRMVSNLDAALDINIVNARVNGGDYFRVRVGPYPTRFDAERTLDDLRTRGVANGFIVDES